MKTAEQRRQYYYSHYETCQKHLKTYKEKNRKLLVQKALIYRKTTNGLAAHRANEAKHRARKIRATPKWLSKEQIKEMALFYKNCPKGYEVDHIVPLRGKDVTGLHVPWNLQYLTTSDNCQKSNKLDLEGWVFQSVG